MKPQHRNILIAALLALAIGWWVGAEYRREKLQDRPVLKWLARAAKSLLWVALVAEEPPQHDQQPLKTHIGEDGYVAVNHGRGW